MKKSTCGHGAEGSGYVKPRDPALANEVENAYYSALIERSTMDNLWVAPPTLPYNPHGSNAQPGWPKDDLTQFNEFVNEKHDIYGKKWGSAHDEPMDMTEFVGINEKEDDIKYIEIHDVSCTPISFDESEFDVITYAEDDAFYPVDPNPPSPLVVEGPGSSSTTTTSDQGIKSPDAS
jgi:hypothetical protein